MHINNVKGFACIKKGVCCQICTQIVFRVLCELGLDNWSPFVEINEVFTNKRGLGPRKVIENLGTLQRTELRDQVGEEKTNCGLKKRIQLGSLFFALKAHLRFSC